MSLPASDDATPDESGPAVPADDPRSWLVGAEEGLAAEMERNTRDGDAAQRPTLLRPGAGLPAEQAPPPATPQGPRPRGRGAVTADLTGTSDYVRGPELNWEPGPRSVPSLHREPAPTRRVTPTRDFPIDDAEERARQRALDLADQAAEAAALGRQHQVISPDVFVAAPLVEPWWSQFGGALASDRRLQALIGLGLILLVTIAMWPRGERPMSIAHLRQQASGVDGEAVLVHGTVDQVFSVGGGFAYYLLDHRDTLVVFTRGVRPRERSHVSVRGTMSTGYLDGIPTLALFESTAR